MATRKKSTPAPTETVPEIAAEAVQTVKHRAKRKNIPPAGLEAQGRVEDAPRVRLHYNPELPPRPRFSDDAQHGLSAYPQQSYDESAQFKCHDVDWFNQVILDDSSAEMVSLMRREHLSGEMWTPGNERPNGIESRTCYSWNSELLVQNSNCRGQRIFANADGVRT